MSQGRNIYPYTRQKRLALTHSIRTSLRERFSVHVRSFFVKKGMVEKKEIAELTGIKKDTLYRNLRDE